MGHDYHHQKIIIRTPGIVANIRRTRGDSRTHSEEFYQREYPVRLQDMFDAVQQKKLWNKKCLPLGGTNQVWQAADPTRGTGPFAPFVQFVCVSSGPVQRTILEESA